MFFAIFDDFGGPVGGLNFADVRFFEEDEAEARLADAAADGLWQGVFEEKFVVGQGGAVHVAGDFELTAQGFFVDADAHAGKFDGTVERFKPDEDIAVEGPIVVVGGAAIVRHAVGKFAADL